MKKLLKFLIAISTGLSLLFPFYSHAEWWAKNANQSLVTNDGSGLANADIHVRNCYIGLGTGTPCGGGGGGGVTSVGLSLPSIFTVSGSPVTTSGTLTGTLNTQSANLVFAGPSIGSAAVPTFRSLTLADLPAGFGDLQSVTEIGNTTDQGIDMLLPTGSTGSLTLDTQTDQGQLMIIPTVDSKGDGKGDFRMQLEQSFVNPDGQRDAVWFWGYNPFKQVNPAEAGIHWSMESHYQPFDGAPPNFEVHLQSEAENGDLNRHLSFIIGKDDGTATLFGDLDSISFRSVIANGSLDWFSAGFDGQVAFSGALAKFSINNTSGTPNSLVIQPNAATTRIQNYEGSMDFITPLNYSFTDTTGPLFTLYRNNTVLYGSSTIDAQTANDVLNLTSTGNGGFPRTVLQLQNTTTTGFSQMVQQDDVGGNNSYTSLVQGNSLATGLSFFGLNMQEGSFLLAGGAGKSLLAMGTQTADPVYLATNDTVRIVIASSGNIAIGSSTASASALLDVPSTTQGFLPPRMTTTQKNAISSPAEGLMVYDVTLHKLCVFTGTIWETVTSI